MSDVVLVRMLDTVAPRDNGLPVLILGIYTPALIQMAASLQGISPSS